MENVVNGAIPSKDLFMMCRRPVNSARRGLPEGYRFRMCRPDELETWMAMHFDFEHTPEQHAEYMKFMRDYYEALYAKDGDLFFKKSLVVCDRHDKLVGRGFMWNVYGGIYTLHWYKVLKLYENRGIGRALLTKMLDGLGPEDYPAFLHTHPSSFRAIKLYSDFGFRLLVNPVIGHRNNDLEECLPILERFMPENDFKNLQFDEAPQYFLDAAAASDIDEF